ncbi:hypothetical protein [uncultured Aquimarina sp.]|uniref:hypothetical protein n=1 Tax=uncultured Aquimarina sp. TaxID=575652 RepID=UPI002620A47B|nr:hypothetical protein [uncultured Aquimarina sp.]
MIINYSPSFQFLDSYVVAFNQDQEDIGNKVRQSMVATMKEIIRVYGAFLQKADKITPIDPTQLPSLRTNNAQLSKLTHASERTIKRHIKRLLASGILTGKIWHGSNASYELFINPKILWIKGVGRVEKSKMTEESQKTISTDNQLNTKYKSTKCPHTEPYKKTYKRNNRIIAVDFVDNQDALSTCEGLGVTDKTTRRSSLPLTSVALTGKKPIKDTKKTRRKDPFEEARRKDAWREDWKNDEEILQKRQTGAQNFEVKPTAEKDKNVPSQATRHAFLSKYALELWQLSQQVLYKDVWLSKRQQNIGLNLVYKWYESVKPLALEKAHRQYKRRIHIVGNYINKDPDHRFVLLPYQFFNIDNKHGFRKSKQWYRKDQEHQRFLQLQRIALREIRRFKRNEQKDTAEGIPRMELFRQCEQRISKLEIPELLDRFYTACSPLLQNEC